MEVTYSFYLETGRKRQINAFLDSGKYDLFANDCSLFRYSDKYLSILDLEIHDQWRHALEARGLIDYSIRHLRHLANEAAYKNQLSEIVVIPGGPGTELAKELMEEGFFPVRYYDSFDLYMLLNYSEAELDDIYRGDPSVIERIPLMSCWRFVPVSILYNAALTSADSFRLGVIAPNLVYSSGRPVTDMRTFLTPNSNRVPQDSIRNETCMIANEVWSVIPVTRYVAGMSRSLFYDTPTTPEYEESSATEWCGTFYYHEPESTTYLAYKRVLRSFNKTTAFEALINELPQGEERDEYQDLGSELRGKSSSALMEHITGELPRDLRLTAPESDAEYYGGDIVYGLYGHEDSYDQPLCQLAAKLGYDIVILESMVGSFQVVTEVLDARSREESLLSLVYTH